VPAKKQKAKRTKGAPAALRRLIATKPGKTNNGRPFNWKELEQVKSGQWRLELIPAEVLGLARPLEVYRKKRGPPFVTPWKNANESAYCPEHWADVKMGEGACGLRCRACFLQGTHRIRCNPARHVLYKNTDEIVEAVRRWLKKPNRRSLGLGIDCSDSLLYEGVTGYAQRIIPMIASADTNPTGCRLILLTKSANVRYLKGLPTNNVAVTFSLNPESIADLWEGKFADGLRVTPYIDKRIAASLQAQKMGFEVRWRVDPVLHPDGWETAYDSFFRDAAERGARPSRITLGTFRMNTAGLLTFAEKWGMPPMEWLPDKMVKAGQHHHEPDDVRVPIYKRVMQMIGDAWRGTRHEPIVALCKETLSARRAVGIKHNNCNCG